MFAGPSSSTTPLLTWQPRRQTLVPGASSDLMCSSRRYSTATQTVFESVRRRRSRRLAPEPTTPREGLVMSSQLITCSTTGPSSLDTGALLTSSGRLGRPILRRSISTSAFLNS